MPHEVSLQLFECRWPDGIIIRRMLSQKEKVHNIVIHNRNSQASIQNIDLNIHVSLIKWLKV